MNGESIYGAGPTPFGSELGEVDNTTQGQEGQSRFQDRQGLALHHQTRQTVHSPLQVPRGGFELSKVEGKVKKAYLLADAKHSSLKLKQTGDKVTVTLPAKAPDAIDSVLVLETAK